MMQKKNKKNCLRARSKERPNCFTPYGRLSISVLWHSRAAYVFAHAAKVSALAYKGLIMKFGVEVPGCSGYGPSLRLLFRPVRFHDCVTTNVGIQYFTLRFGR